MVDDFDRRLQFLARQVAWIVVMFMILPFCLGGIYVGYQYMDDECVRKTSYSLALDWWLIVACVFDMFFWFVVMILLCAKAKYRCRRIFIWPMNVGNIAWMSVGIWLLVESQIRCQHNTLWVISLVVIVLSELGQITISS